MELIDAHDVEPRPAGLGAQIAERLTKAILEGMFKGGDQLIEQELQAQFGVSRSPLREAFRELEKKGLVDIQPRRGTFVKRITRRDIQDHFPVRAVLEGLAARLAAGRMNEQTLKDLETALTGMEQAVASADTGGYYRHHLTFHELFIHASANDLLIATLQTLRMQNLWHRFSYRYYQESLENSFAVHQRIFELFRDHGDDSEAVGSVVEAHINVALTNFLEYLQHHETTDEEDES